MFSLLSKLNALAILIIIGILGIFFISLFAAITIRSKYIFLGSDISNTGNRTRGVFEHSIFNTIIEDYNNARHGSFRDINTQAIIERNFNYEFKKLNLGERFINNAISLMIILGLLGTFYGLTLSIGKLVELLSSTGNTEVLGSMDTIVSGLIDSVKGMSVAFITSLFGIACSILLTVLKIFFNVEEARESVMVQIEEYLDNNVAFVLTQREKEQDYERQKTVWKDSLESIGTTLEKNLHYVAETMGNQFVAAANSMAKTANDLSKSIEEFDQSLQKFNENTRDFSEFNYHLRSNIDRMNVGFADLTENLNKHKDNIKGLNERIDGLTFRRQKE
ncbi:MAG: MotA/TolQ/ExbB proton channel family protein [Thermotaleaceae bacterium]